MRIGCFTDRYLRALHGVEVSIEALRKRLRTAGHEVFVYAPAVPRYRDTWQKVFRLTFVRVIERPEMRLACPLVEHGHLRDVLRVRLDIAHAHTPFTLGLLGRHVSVSRRFRWSVRIAYAYAHFIGESTEYVLNQVIDTVLGKDKDYLRWRTSNNESFVPRVAGKRGVGPGGGTRRRVTPVAGAA